MHFSLFKTVFLSPRLSHISLLCGVCGRQVGVEGGVGKVVGQALLQVRQVFTRRKRADATADLLWGAASSIN